MRLVAIEEIYDPSDVVAAESLLRLISPNEESAGRLLGLLHQELSEEGDYDDFSELPIIWVLAQFSGFYVDWKDGESFSAFVEKLAHEWGVRDFRFPQDLQTETGDRLTVPELMHWGRGTLERYGLLLWHWNTDEDNYCGAICREKDWPEIMRVCELLEVIPLPADMQFGIDA